jgi:hypothetical protein
LTALPSPAGDPYEGERRRDLGTALATANRWERSLAGELVFLDALASPGATATTDVIPDNLAAAYGDGGKWVGGIALRLLKTGLIHEVDQTRSARPSRHRGRLGVYAIADRAKAEQRRAELRGLIAALPRLATEQASTEQPTLF